MLYLHKLLPSIFLPIGITLVLVGAGLILRKRWLSWSGLGLLYLFSTEAVSGKIMGWIEGTGSRREMELVEPAEAVVVLSGMLQDRKDAKLGEWSDAMDRFEGGVELFQARKASLLIFTGGHVPWRPEDRPEGEILKKRAVKLGVPGEKIVVTGRVGNTAQEAEAVVKLFRNSEFEIRKQINPKIILVTSAFHMRRAKMLFERQGFEVDPFPVDFQTSDRPTMSILSFIPSAQALAKSETAMREGIGILYYSIIKR